MQEKTFFIAILDITEDMKEVPDHVLYASFPRLFDGLQGLLGQPPVSGAIDLNSKRIEIVCQNPADALLLESTWEKAKTFKR